MGAHGGTAAVSSPREEAAGMSVSSVVMGQSLPWAADRDPPWVGPAASDMAAAVMGDLQCWFSQPGSSLPPPNWRVQQPQKTSSFCKGDQQLHHPLEPPPHSLH